MDESKRTRTIRVVGYSRRVLQAQGTIAASAVAIVVTALLDGWMALPAGAVSLVLLLAAVWQVLQLRNEGFEIQIEEEAAVEESPPEPSEQGELSEPAEDDEEGGDEPSEDSLPLHWTETAYPDPDEELYPAPVAQESAGQPDDEQE